MRKFGIATALFFALPCNITLYAHCQMPCGVYHDQMIYDKIDEYYETMYKCVAAMNNNEFKTVTEKNQFIRWVMTKDRMSDEVAEIITAYFLQQKIEPTADNADMVASLHKILFLLPAIKQNADLKMIKQFGDEWDHFKSLFHPELICTPPKPPKNDDQQPKKGEPPPAPKMSLTIDKSVKAPVVEVHIHDHEHDHDDHDHPHTH